MSLWVTTINQSCASVGCCEIQLQPICYVKGTHRDSLVEMMKTNTQHTHKRVSTHFLFFVLCLLKRDIVLVLYLLKRDKVLTPSCLPDIMPKEFSVTAKDAFTSIRYRITPSKESKAKVKDAGKIRYKEIPKYARPVNQKSREETLELQQHAQEDVSNLSLLA